MLVASKSTRSGDEAKRKRNIRKHGLDFAGCDAILDHFTATREDVREDYGEARCIEPITALPGALENYSAAQKQAHLALAPGATRQMTCCLGVVANSD